LMLISKSGIVIRTELTTISQQGRASQGVAVMNLKPNDKVACIAVLDGSNGDEGTSDGDEATASASRASRLKPSGTS
ncbi:MAG: hypothetical protein H0V51_08820, partial [Chloroflexi bacterium]|nr:hypothetical protein [Chloroflexota bacterium]